MTNNCIRDKGVMRKTKRKRLKKEARDRIMQARRDDFIANKNTLLNRCSISEEAFEEAFNIAAEELRHRGIFDLFRDIKLRQIVKAIIRDGLTFRKEK